MRSFTDIFIKKPVLAIVINLIILAVGWRSIDALAVRQYPRLESSAIVITTVYVGASAETVRGFITTPIEQAVSAIDGIDYIESSSRAGVSTVTVRLRLNHDSNDALAEISARLNQVRSRLPADAEAPAVDIQRTDKPYATFYISFTSEQLSLVQLNDFLIREVQPEFQTIAGVQRVAVEGSRELAMRVWLDTDKMESFDISPSEVWDALGRNNFLAAVGRTKSRDVQIDLLTDTDLKAVSEFRDLIVREREGTLVRLGDIAKVELGSEEPTGQAGFNGTPAIWLSVWPLPRANELEVAKLLKKRIEEVRPTLPAGIEMTLAYDGTYYMENAIKEITKTLVETVAIVALVVFIFMGSVRTVIVPLFAMPVSLIGSCIAILLFGFSLNLLTILAIVLSVGLVVDDAIVMVENVERHIRAGKARFEAALIGARELAAPVVSMTITLAAVYAPIGFQSGLTGMLFREFAFTLATAVVISGIVAVTLSPVLSSWMIPPGGKEGRLTRAVNRVFARIRSVYERVLGVVLRAWWAVVIASVAICALAPSLYTRSKKELAPTEDEGIVFAVVQTAPDATLDYTVRGFSKVADAFMSVPEAKFFFQVAELAMGGGFGGIQTIDWHERDRTTEPIQGEVIGKLMMIEELRSIAVRPAPLPGAGQFDVELMVTSGAEAPEMEPIINQIIGAGYASEKFVYVDSDLKIDLPQTRIEIDRKKVADLGLDLADVGRDLSVLLAGGYVNRFNYEGRSYKVIPQVGDELRQIPEQVLQWKVRTRDGGSVTLRSLVTLRTEAVPRVLTRFQQRNSAKVYGVVAPGVTKEEALSALEQAAREIVPPGYAIDYAGESRQMRTEGATLVSTLGFAVGIIYLVLAAQFGSFRDPFIVLFGSVPLALTGALVFTATGITTVNIYSQVGLITLVGLVAKNGILIVEFANQLQEQGLSKRDAVRQAAGTRLRPILMTSAATIFGHFPLVLVSGAGAEARNSIGIVLVSGMAISTVFTLFVVPSIYILLAARRKPSHAPDTPATTGAGDAPSPVHASGGSGTGPVSAGPGSPGPGSPGPGSLAPA
ncbi:MAG: efflux RND transporter permease subunit [Phycisphaeraceae bacterium]|nr:MAG: efflux RND transporter permease subunit [Phycisphaeraceae bacterium]